MPRPWPKTGTAVPPLTNYLFAGNIGNRIQGHISDSPVGVSGLPKGISRIITDSKPIQSVIHKSIKTYLNTFSKSINHSLTTAQGVYFENPFRFPTLYLYSYNDVMFWPETLNIIAANRNKHNMSYVTHEFDSPHVQHFKFYPEKYSKLLDDFIDSIGINNLVIPCAPHSKEKADNILI